jgi:hypothetical protein
MISALHFSHHHHQQHNTEREVDARKDSIIYIGHGNMRYGFKGKWKIRKG